MMFAFLRGSEIGILVLVVFVAAIALLVGLVWLLIKIFRRKNHGN